MVNSKKMSKSSIAVIVLSILLVLSMILGLTGAWFTDTKSNSENKEEITFGRIEIDTVGTTFADENDVATALPGDVLNFSGSVLMKDYSEDAYVKVSPSTTAVKLYVDQTHNNSAFDYSFEGWGTVEGWTVVKTYDDGSKLFKVTKGSNAMTISGTITVDADLENIAYNESGAEVRVNSVLDGKYEINFGVSAVAVQARNLCDKASGWLETEITEIETALADAMVAVQA